MSVSREAELVGDGGGPDLTLPVGGGRLHQLPQFSVRIAQQIGALVQLESAQSICASQSSSSPVVQFSAAGTQQVGLAAQSRSVQSTRRSQSSSSPFVHDSGEGMQHAGATTRSGSEQSMALSHDGAVHIGAVVERITVIVDATAARLRGSG